MVCASPLALTDGEGPERLSIDCRCACQARHCSHQHPPWIWAAIPPHVSAGPDHYLVRDQADMDWHPAGMVHMDWTCTIRIDCCCTVLGPESVDTDGGGQES